jgi:type IV pilus assembly protein PilA
MTRASRGSMSSGSSKKSGVPVIAWILGGCGCLGCGGFIFLMLLAIALPSFLNQVGKAKASEAKSILETINKTQTAYSRENGSFAKSIDDLGLKLQPGRFFTYQIKPMSNPNVAIVTATASQTELKSYTGVVFKMGSGPTASLLSGVCETDTPATTPPEFTAMPSPTATAIECPPGSTLIP